MRKSDNGILPLPLNITLTLSMSGVKYYNTACCDKPKYRWSIKVTVLNLDQCKSCGYLNKDVPIMLDMEMLHPPSRTQF